MSSRLRWDSFETWNKLMNPSFLWKYPTFHIKGSRSFGCIPRSNRRQILFTIIGETFVFLFGFLGSFLLLLVEVLTGQSFGVFANMFLTLVALLATSSLQFSFVLFTNRELFVSGMRHIVYLESDLSIGKSKAFVRFLTRI
jgi:hypothetical protein